MGIFTSLIQENDMTVEHNFLNVNVKNACTTNNTIGKRQAVEQDVPQSKYDRSGVYQLTCPKCKMK